MKAAILGFATVLVATKANEFDEQNWARFMPLNACENCDLIMANLSKTSLSEANLRMANLSWATLRGANLNRAKLKNAKLVSAILCETLMP